MSFLGLKAIDIKLVGPNLVAAFHRAQPPLVWRFDLERNHSFTIALQGEEGDWELGINSTKGEFYPIVHFAAREDAEEALAAVQKMLMRKQRSKIWGVFKWLLLLLVLGIIVFVGWLVWPTLSFVNHLSSSTVIPSSPAASSMMGMAPIPSTDMAPAVQVAPPQQPLPSGIPLPADEVLKPPK